MPSDLNDPTGYRYIDAIKLPAVAADCLGASVPVGVHVFPPGRTRKFKCRMPLFLDDPDGVGLFSPFKEDTIHCPPIFVATARNAKVVGFRTILTENGLFFNDDSTVNARGRREFLKEFAMPDPLNEETGMRVGKAADRFTLSPGGRSVECVSGTTVLLSSAEPSNYGSWLFRVVPKLATLERIRLSPTPRYLVWAGLPSFLEYLAFMGIAEDRVIQLYPEDKIYHLECVIVPSVRNNQAFLDAESVALFRRLRERFGGPRQSGRKIYVSRLQQSQQGSSRVMLNEAELVERLIAHDFRIVYPERLSVAEQILEFSSAELVVGPSGSGMFNVVFCHPGTKVIDIESEPHWIHAHRSLFSSCDLRYGIFVGKAVSRNFSAHHQPWKVNIKALIARIQTLL